MHICLISDEYLKENPLGGIGTYTRQFSKLLDSMGYQVTIVTFGSVRTGKYKSGKINVEIIKKLQIPMLSLLIDPFLVLVTILRINKETAIDIIETPEWRALGFFIAYFKFFFRAFLTLVVRLHTPLIVIRLYNAEQLSPSDRLRDWMERFSVKYADAVTCPSNSLAIWAKQKWISRSDIVLIPNFVECLNEEKSPIIHKNKRLLFMGSLAFVKGFDTFLKALPMVFTDFKVDCRIVGRISPDSPLNSMLNDILFQWKNVKYLGFLEGECKRKELESADVVVIPSIWDNFPMVCIEALVSSKIVVASNVGGLKDIISDGVNGFLVQPNNPADLAEKIKEVMQLPEKEELRIRNNARLTVCNKFSSSVVSKQIINLYLDCIQKHEESIAK